jgi:TolB protein
MTGMETSNRDLGSSKSRGTKTGLESTKGQKMGMRHSEKLTILVALVVLLGLGNPLPSHAQERRDSFPGVSLGLKYEGTFQPVLAIKPFSSRFGGGGVESQVQAIVGRDLRYSDRFEMLDSLPASMVGEGIDYTLWDQLNATWLVSGQVEGAANGYTLVLDLHNVVYAELREHAEFTLPDPSSEHFRMAVHRVSDQIVEWISGEPGMAASKIAYSRASEDGVQEIYIVDSDGENVRRLTNNGDLTKSPSWHPSGEKLAYVRSVDFTPHQIFEHDLKTGRVTPLNPGREGQQATPTYHPNGRVMAFGIMGNSRAGLFSYDVERDCCLTHIQGGRWEDLSPSYSPDGDQIVFNSNRLGTHIPQVYSVSAQGGQPDLVSPYVPGSAGYYTSPDWSPVDNRVAFHGRISRYGRYQILVGEVEGRNTIVSQLTTDGNNEDPSWAPDGRHLVFSGERSYGYGLFVVDLFSGRIRPLVSNIRPVAPEWSPSLARSVEETLRGVGF